MPAAEIPQNEPLRLAALHATGLLDTPPEERFDRLTRLARFMFGVDIALVSLVAHDRQWFKSRQGLEATETPREVSFCSHAIRGSRVFEVTDARQDPRFCDNPLVTGAPGIRFYAGAPLTMADGHRIGTLCIIDTRPRQLSRVERHALRDLADCVEQAIGHGDLQEHGKALRLALQSGEVIVRAQSQFIREPDRRKAFDDLLADILDLTESGYGFIGEVLHRADGTPYLKTRAITDIAWDDASRAFVDAHARTGIEFCNLDSLFGAAIRSGEPVIANSPRQDPRSGGLPPGHPPLDAFLGVPIHHGDHLVAMLGLANRPGGYDEDLVEFLRPLLATIGQLVEAARIRQQHAEALVELRRLSRVASETTNGVLITDAAGCIEWINAGFTRLSGYALDDLRGRRPDEVLSGPESDPATMARTRDARARGNGFALDAVIYDRSRDAHWVRLTCTPLRDADGRLEGFITITSDITQARKDAERIRSSEQRLAAVIEGGRIGTWEWNVQTGETVFNDRWAEMLGYSLADLMPLSIRTLERLTHPEDYQAARALLARHFSGEDDSFVTQSRMRHKDGHWVWVSSRGRVTTWTADGKPLRMLGTHIDVSAFEATKATLREQADYTQAVLDNIVDGIVTIDRAGTIVSFNPSAERIFGYHSAEIVGHNVKTLMPSPHREAHDGYLQSYQATGESRIIGVGRELRGLRKDGSLFPIELAVSEVMREGRPMFVGLVRDITQRKAAEREIERLAFYDPLTGLPNRRLLLDRLQHALSRSGRSAQFGALMFIDLDNFKNLNDTAGHGIGDELLKQVAQRLSTCLREGDTVARLGGDEFVVILEGVHEVRETAANQVETVVENIHSALMQPYRLGDREHRTTTSIGVTLFRGRDHSVDDLLQRADLAMYQAKSSGRNTFRFFDPQIQAAVMARTEMESDLRSALAGEQFALHFQRQVDRNGDTTGAEVLLRWKHPQRGMVSPAQFIPLAEETGLIVPIGRWVFLQACAVLARWAARPLTARLTLSINISVRQFHLPDFVDRVLAALETTGADPRRLKLELTESMLVSSVDDIVTKMIALKARGLSFSLDDFGTGYSSLAYLKRLPLDQLKIDQSFVRDILSDPNDAAIARTIVALGESMGLGVIAEGVETDAHRQALAAMGCNAYQGYHFGRPVPLEQFEQDLN